MNPDIARLANREIDGPITVGRIRSGVAKAYGTDENWVWLSIETLRKQLLHHRELKLDFYQDLDWLLSYGEILPDQKNHCLSVIHRIDDGSPLFKATVKVIRANKRLMLLSVHRISNSDYKRLVRRAAK